MSDNNITTQSTEKGTKSLFLVFGMVALSFVVTVIANSLNNYGGFNYFDSPVLVYIMVGESLSGLILFPLMHIAIASIWKSKRNKRTRRNVFFGWALATAIIYLFGGLARIQHISPSLHGEKIVANSDLGNQGSRVSSDNVRQAAEQGDTKAQFNLGVSYDNGLGVPKDDQQAIAWYRKAAEQGDAKAQYMLGSSYAYGVGVPQDKQQAYAWYSVAAANGYNDAVTKRDKAASTLTRNQLNEAQELATHYFEQHQPQ